MAGLPRELKQELEGAPWMYEFELAPGVTTRTYSPTMRHYHASRMDMIGPIAAEQLAHAGPWPRALDPGCNEGWFSHQQLEEAVPGPDVHHCRDDLGLPFTIEAIQDNEHELICILKKLSG